MRARHGVLLRPASEHNHMAYSGTVSETTFDTRRVIEHAARRCRIPAQLLTAESVSIATELLYLLMSELPNKGLQLWAVQKSIYPLYDGVSLVPTYKGTIDILNATLRSLQEVTGTNVDTSTSRTTTFTNPVAVSTVGLRWSAAAVAIEFARSDDGVVWTTIQAEVPSAAAGEWTWYDLGSVVDARFFRVQATGGNLATSQIFLGTMPSEITMAPLSRDEWTSLPNKAFKSNRPLQYWLDRQSLSPMVNLWPVPNAAATTMQLVVWAKRHLMDVGSMTQSLEFPQRWYEAIVAMLAAKLALELPDVDPSMIPLLDQKAGEALYVAQQEEREGGATVIVPNISAYTR